MNFLARSPNLLETSEGPLFSTVPLYEDPSSDPSFQELHNISKQITRRHLMNGLSAWEDESLQEHLASKTTTESLLNYLESKMGLVAAHEVGDRLVIP